MSNRTHIEAWRLAVSQALDGQRDVLTHAEAQSRRNTGALSTRYVLVDVMHRYGAPRQACGATPMRGWRLALLIVGTEWEVAWARERLDALTDGRLAALDSTALTHETDDENSDGGLLSLWTYATPA